MGSIERDERLNCRCIHKYVLVERWGFAPKARRLTPVPRSKGGPWTRAHCPREAPSKDSSREVLKRMGAGLCVDVGQ